MKKLTVVGLIVIILVSMAWAAGSRGTIVVQMNGFRHEEGYAMVALFNSADGFPDQEHKAYRKDRVQIKGGRARVVFSDLPYGEYAVAMFHDENNSGKLEKNFLGIPKEGHGVSGDDSGFPEFNKNKFMFNKDQLLIDIRVYY